MDDAKKTKEQLIEELTVTRARVTELEDQLKQVEPLAEERKLWDMFMDHTPDFVFLKDTQSRFMKISKAHALMMGLDSPQEAIGKTDFELFPQEDAQRFYDEEQKIMSAKEPVFGREWSFPGGSGETVWVSEHKIPVTDETDQVIGLLGITRNITRRILATEEQEQLQKSLIEAQKRAIEELSSPVIPIMNAPDGSGGIIVMPLIGSIDSLRARDVTRSLLAGISRHRAKIVILDVTGVGIMDTGIVNHLNKTIQAARLKGAKTIVTGISDAVAESIVDLGIDWSEITTLSDLQTGLMMALSDLGLKLSYVRSS